MTVQTAPTTTAQELISWLRDYATHRINSRMIDERRTIPPHVVLDLGNKGILGMQVPKRYGGLELSTVDLMLVIQQLTAIDMTLGTFVGLNNWLGIWPIQMYASEAVKQELLPGLAWGRELAAFAFTEPAAGSDARSIRTTATVQDDGLQCLNGEKSWIGSGAWAGVTTVFAQQLDAAGRPSGISGYVVKAGTAGLVQGPEALTMGMRGMIQNTVRFEDARVSEDYLLGKKNAGMDIAQDIMMHARLGIAGLSLGGMKRCAQLMLRYAQRRRISTGVLLDNPITQARLSDISAAITAVDSLVFGVGRLMDENTLVPNEVYTACKSTAPELFGEATDHLTQLLGARGYIETNGVPQLLRDARILRIFEGPTETMNMYLGGRILKGAEDFHGFLENVLKAGALSLEIKAAAQAIQDAASDHAFLAGDALVSKRWVQFKVGQIASYGILRAFLHKACLDSKEARLKRASQWAGERFEQLKRLALDGCPEELALSDIAQVTAEIEGLRAAIGDIEQRLPLDDQRLDAYLHKDPQAPQETPAPRPVEPPTVTPAEPFCNQVADAEALKVWLKVWISRCVEIPVTQVQADEPFTSFGLDSTDAVEIVYDLEQHIGQELDATLLWNYPTIDALVGYLLVEMDDAASPARSVNPVQTPAEPVRSAADIAAMSDEEVLGLLLKEVSA